MKVVDASALINFLAFPNQSNERESVFKDDLIAPALLIPEFLNGLRKIVLRKTISQSIADQIVEEFRQMRIELLTLSDGRTELWSLTKNMTPYDAEYVLTAKLTMSPLVTSDARLARTAKRNTDVILLERA